MHPSNKAIPLKTVPVNRTGTNFHASKKSFAYNILAKKILHIIITEQAIKEIPLYIVYMFPINPSLSSLSNSVIAEMDQAL